jgi:hypothetical protein
MVVDTELRGKDQPASTAKPLDVDRFPSSYVVEPRSGPIAVEGTLSHGTAGAIYFANGDIARHDNPKDDYLVQWMKSSTDNGRTWGEKWRLKDKSGHDIDGTHNTLLRLKSGSLGLVHSTTKVPNGRPGRDGGTVFRTSDDEGKTWSDSTVVESRFGICCTGHAIVLDSGRIVVPVYKWISYDPTGEAESMISPTVSYAYVYVSDDQGRTWTQSLSELFVSHYRAAYDLEEPAVVELKDGRLLMHMRSQLGGAYRCFSSDQGICWTKPERLPYAAGYTPHCLKRIPSTGHLLTVWTQVSRQEILCGLHRHRLTCAISKDEGQTWENFKNLESLDDVAVVKPPPVDRIEVIEQWEDYGYYQPVNTKRYHRAPGVLRIGYPDVLFANDEAIIVYDHGMGTLGVGVGGIRQRIIPVGWFAD